ncbi:hypothetical protein LZ575_07585 [Antarcticibacterium sp. 1MA-6-2]|uniref:hypothetical protein n=1 Tax=Antarcticibacterium sp. 1MA-6-2 TaxID=2908210 RepID=UPI001F325629|nr:hypothetical protein [Antarcticibacterium sp. 1MA-6-2]UJH92378.1 hypothetical protein LZ575_07585 [Antarcticibacterium sp. 1MA-6-2]
MNSKSGRYITNLLSLPPVYFFLFQKLLKQKRFVKTHLEKELLPYRINSDGSLEQLDIKKVLSYYSLGVPAVLGESLCVLRGKKMLPQERLCMTFLGGISGLLDDLFDDPEKEVEHLENFILKPEALIPANDYEKLLQHLYESGLHYSFVPEQIKHQAFKVFQSQKHSLKQQEIKLEAKKIEEITYLKGGNSFLYYRLCLNHPLEKKEQKFSLRIRRINAVGQRYI